MASSVAPESIAAGPLVLRRVKATDAGAVARAVEKSLGHLAPWMPWATPDAAAEAGQHSRLGALQGRWEQGEDFEYLMLADGALVGSCGMHRRVGRGGIEIGYWVHVDHTRRGYATAAARALTEAAMGLGDVARVEIRCDSANVASQAVARRLGYRLDRIEDDGISAPGESGQGMVWVMDVL